MKTKKYIKPHIKQIIAGMPSKIGTSQATNVVSSIDGTPVDELVEKYGSPLFVISENKLRETIQEAKNAFETRYPKVQFAWSYKTNYLSAVCNVFHQEGHIAEVVSGFEYHKALKNGVPGNKIIFNGPDKSENDLTLAIQNDSLIHIDHFDELQTMIRLAKELNKKPKVAVRLNMDTGMYPIWDRFGFNYENGQALDAITKIMHSEVLELSGLHCHIGTYVQDVSAYRIAIEKLVNLMGTILFKFGHHISYLDIGGGFASNNTLRGAYLPAEETTPTFAQYAETITNAILASGYSNNKLPVLFLETGRALIDDSASLIGSVLANKRLSDGRKALIVDVGVNILFTAFWYEHKITPAQASRSSEEPTIIYGPLCMNIDVVRSAINIQGMEKGDKFIVHSVGAYNMTQWLQFIQMRPNVVMLDTSGKPHLIREAETLDTIDRHEKVPAHLQSFSL